jgi:glycosyltransferase involved in cell wall biosynthesis
MLGKVQPDPAQRGADAALQPVGDASSQRPARGRRVCIVGLGSISHNPRVVKEADALAAAGYDVVVLFLQHFEWARAMDRRILERAKWRADIVEVFPSVSGSLRRWVSALQLLLFRGLCRWTMRFPVAELAYSRYFFPLLRRALRQRSDLYIGHYTGNLPVVALAARWTGAKFAFDFEDFHRGEVGPSGGESLSTRFIATLEDRYLPAASFVTAASWGIAEEVAKTTGLSAPTTVLNVFPWSDRAKLPTPSPRPPNAALSLYWFSQIVSMDRGLQDVIGAMALMHERAELHIRGDGMNGSIESLRRLSEEFNASERIHFHPIVPPEELLADAAEHDVGLCLEVPATPNKDACISNKIFVYMLAGLAIVASRTRGQSDILNAAPEIGLLYDPGDIHTLAAILDRYAADRALLARTKTAALAGARERWNWERESELLVSLVRTAG